MTAAAAAEPAPERGPEAAGPPPLALFDAHLHVVDPRFPLVPNQGYVPDPFSVADYLTTIAGLRVPRSAAPCAAEEKAPTGARRVTLVGGAVVSGSFQALDQAYLLDALARLGPGFVGVTQLSPETADAALRSLDAAGVRAVRVNLKRGGPASLRGLDAFARRVHDVVGWHVEVYLDGADLAALAPALARLPHVVVDHLGLARAGLPALLALVAEGASVKATGFGRLDFDPGPVLQAIARENPGALLVGTDLPSTRAPRPFAATDLTRVVEALAAVGGDALTRALVGNARALYRPAARQGPSGTVARRRGSARS